MDAGRAADRSPTPDPPIGGRVARRHPLADPRSGWFVVAVVVLFGLTRLTMVWWTQVAEDHTLPFDAVGGRIDPTGDISIYECITDRIRLDGRPYADVIAEYPPGSLPFMTAPQALKELASGDECKPTDEYHLGFILLMAGVDVVGLVALVLMARRGGSVAGVWFWVALLPLLGPVVYSRFDLVPAVAVVLALERAQANRWFGAGGWLGLGAVVKLTPAFVAPATFLVAPTGERRRVIYGFGAVAALLLVPWIGVLPEVYDQVLGYHSERGIQIESLWGSLVLLLDHVDVPAEFAIQFGAFEVVNSFSDTLKTLSNLLAVGVLLATTLVAWRRCRRGSAPDLAMVSLATMALLVGVGRVYSPQYVVWLLGAAAVALVLNGRRAWVPAAIVAVITPMTWWIYPYLYNDIVGRELGPTVVLLVRNLLTLAVGVTAVAPLLRQRRGALPSADATTGDQDAEPSAEPADERTLAPT